jgi:hypothetical protein
VSKRTRATVPSRFKGNLFRRADVNAGVSTTFVQTGRHASMCAQHLFGLQEAHNVNFLQVLSLMTPRYVYGQSSRALDVTPVRGWQ